MGGSVASFHLMWERSDSLVECLTRDQGTTGSSLTGFPFVVSLSKNINPSLVLVQPRKYRPFITERLLMERKESNRTNKHSTGYSHVRIERGGGCRTPLENHKLYGLL